MPSELLFLGRDYPQGYQYFRERLHRAFWSQKDLKDVKKIEEGVKRAEFVKKEIEALYVVRGFQLQDAHSANRYYLKRYRTLRKAYDKVD